MPCNNLSISDVVVTISDVSGVPIFTTTSNANGDYSFSAVPFGMDYRITATKDAPCQTQLACGLGDDDALQIERHVLGIELIDNPLDLIAADVNDDGMISVLDIVVIERIVLCINESTDPIGDVWNFVASNYTFMDPMDPFGELVDASEIMITDSSSQSNHNFNAIKMGDVNCSYSECEPPFISMVRLWDNSFQNPSGPGIDNYTDFTDVCIPILETNIPQIIIAASQGKVYMALYIDLDKSGDYNTTNEEMLNSFDQNGFWGVVINTSMLSGETKIRVIISDTPITNPNEITTCGETEDYVLCGDCEPITPVIVVNNVDISNDLTYTLPCNAPCFIIDPGNITDPVYTISVPINDNSSINGQFCINENTPETFTVEISGKDSCGEPYEETITITIDDDCEECELEALTSVGSCSDNGTPGDPTDDYYNITLEVFNTDDQSWTVVDSNGLTIYFGDGNENNVDLGDYLVLNGSEGFQIRYGDNCFLDFGVVAPTSCNFSCNISAVISEGECNDNGTPEDPSDDTYTIFVSVLGTNGISWDLVGYAGSQPISFSGTGNTTNIELGPISVNAGAWIMYISPTGLVDSSCKRYETTIFPPKCSGGEKRLDKVSIAPNPSIGRMNILVETAYEVQNISLRIYDFSGIQVDAIENLKVENRMLDYNLDLTAKLRQGIYFFIFNIGNETITKQVIIE